MTQPRFHSLNVGRHARVGVVGDSGRARETWLILHGYGMLSQGILHWFRAAASPERVLVAPEALSRFYTESRGLRLVGASWMTREAREHDLLDLMAYLDQVGEEFLPREGRIELHGFSQGVAAVARWVVHSGREVDRLVCWGGTLPDDVAPGSVLPLVRERCVHYVVGRRDTRTPQVDVLMHADQVRAAGLPVTVHEFDGGHRIDDAVLADLTASR